MRSHFCFFQNSGWGLRFNPGLLWDKNRARTERTEQELKEEQDKNLKEEQDKNLKEEWGKNLKNRTRT